MEILAVLDDAKYTIIDVLCTIAENLFDGVGILHNANVQSVLAEYPYTRIESIFKSKMPTDERDLLGIVYQSSMMEGTKNLMREFRNREHHHLCLAVLVPVPVRPVIS